MTLGSLVWQQPSFGHNKWLSSGQAIGVLGQVSRMGIRHTENRDWWVKLRQAQTVEMSLSPTPERKGTQSTIAESRALWGQLHS